MVSRSNRDRETFTPEEREALRRALGDGFDAGYTVPGTELPASPEQLPEDVDSGLYEHEVHVSGKDGAPSGWEALTKNVEPDLWFEGHPFKFDYSCLKAFFDGKAGRIRDNFAEAFPEDAATENSFVFMALQLGVPVYSKAWFEACICEDMAVLEEVCTSGPLDALLNSVIHVAGTNGRLVSEYYWKFSHERAAVTGAVVSAGGERGGAARSKALERSPIYTEMQKREDQGELIGMVARSIVRRERLPIKSRSLERGYRRWKHKQASLIEKT